MNKRERARMALAQSLGRRSSTWQVAQAIIDLGCVDRRTRLHSQLASLAGSGRRSWAMNDDFDRVDPVDTQLATLVELLPAATSVQAREDDVVSLRIASQVALASLGLAGYGSASAVMAEWPQAKLQVHGLSQRPAKRRVRFLRDFDERVDRLADVQRLRAAQMRAKSRLAAEIDADACDDITLAFCAYLAARANRRSIFTSGSQSRAFDNISEALLESMERRASRGADVAWRQAALVRPTERVLSRLGADEFGELIGISHAAMADASRALEALYPTLPERMRDEMVMVRGIDSSRWNAYAGAFNTMRAMWISCTLAAGLDDVLDSYLPGKVCRLMAADVAWWHKSGGGDVHSDTDVQALLAPAWDVIAGRAQQGRGDVEVALTSLGMSIKGSGWSAPRALDPIEVAQAEPTLVHGVVVSDPALASVLRRCGAFSGKGLRELDRIAGIDIERSIEVGPGDGEQVVVAAGHRRATVNE